MEIHGENSVAIIADWSEMVRIRRGLEFLIDHLDKTTVDDFLNEQQMDDLMDVREFVEKLKQKDY